MESSLFFFNDTATTEIYTLSLHDALPIYREVAAPTASMPSNIHMALVPKCPASETRWATRSEEHTSELQSRQYLVCRLLLEKNKFCTVLSRLPPSRRFCFRTRASSLAAVD